MFCRNHTNHPPRPAGTTDTTTPTTASTTRTRLGLFCSFPGRLCNHTSLLTSFLTLFASPPSCCSLLPWTSCTFWNCFVRDDFWPPVLLVEPGSPSDTTAIGPVSRVYLLHQGRPVILPRPRPSHANATACLGFVFYVLCLDLSLPFTLLFFLSFFPLLSHLLSRRISFFLPPFLSTSPPREAC